MRVPVGIKVGAFAVVVMSGYSWFANSIPQIESKPPEELSLEGGTVTPALMGGTYEVNSADVVCGNVQTANATVYIINTVLMPPSS